MPNVAGREFPYTPQGMAAAEQYKQSLGMRGGGMMGFRPVGYRDGDLVELDEPYYTSSPMNAGEYLIDRVVNRPTYHKSEFFLNQIQDPAGPDLSALIEAHPAYQRGLKRGIADRKKNLQAVEDAEVYYTHPNRSAPGDMSKAIDTVSSLVQEFMAQGVSNVSDLARKVTNTAHTIYGMSDNVVTAILKSLGVPVSDIPITLTPEQVQEYQTGWRGAGYPGSAMEKYHQSGNPLNHPGVDPITGDYYPPEYFDPPDDIPAPRRNPLRATGAGDRFSDARAIEAMGEEGRRGPDAPVSDHAKYYPYEEPDPSLIPLREPGTGLPQSIPSGMRHGGIMSLRRR